METTPKPTQAELDAINEAAGQAAGDFSFVEGGMTTTSVYDCDGTCIGTVPHALATPEVLRVLWAFYGIGQQHGERYGRAAAKAEIRGALGV